MSDKQLGLKVELPANGAREGGHATPDSKDEFQLSSRDAGRSTLRGAVLTVTPSAAPTIRADKHPARQ